MKALLLYSIVLPSLLFGQITNHFSHQDSKWHVAKTYTAATQEHPSFAATTTKIYGVQGDSLMSGETWFKMYSTSDSIFQNNLVYEGMTRAVNDLVLFIDTLNQMDTLYNFDLDVGDSVFYDLGITPDWIYVEAIDTLLISGEEYRKFWFSEPEFVGFFQLNEVWIEGIGSIHGPLFPRYPRRFIEEVPDSLILSCSFTNAQAYYDHPGFSDCYVDITLGIENQEALNFNIYPNPVSSILTIETEQNCNGGIEIYDVNGKLIQSKNVDGKVIKIDVSEWENGVYFLNFEVGGRKVVKRFMVGNE